MTIEVGTDPAQPIPLICSINVSGELEVQYTTSSMTHPQAQDLRVDLDEADDATFKTADFQIGSVLHTVAATMVVGGTAWTDGGSTVSSGGLYGDEDPGKLHEVDVSATNTSTNETTTVRIRLRIREQTIRPLPPGS